MRYSEEAKEFQSVNARFIEARVDPQMDHKKLG
jgi:hypothetical protein